MPVDRDSFGPHAETSDGLRENNLEPTFTAPPAELCGQPCDEAAWQWHPTQADVLWLEFGEAGVDGSDCALDDEFLVWAMARYQFTQSRRKMRAVDDRANPHRAIAQFDADRIKGNAGQEVGVPGKKRHHLVRREDHRILSDSLQQAQFRRGGRECSSRWVPDSRRGRGRMKRPIDQPAQVLTVQPSGSGSDHENEHQEQATQATHGSNVTVRTRGPLLSARAFHYRHRMAEHAAIRVSGALTIPRDELVLKASRSGGPGGQHVNTSSTRIELVWDVAASPSLDQAQRAHLLTRLATKLDSQGKLRLVAQDERSQLRNREAVIERFIQLVARGLVVPRKRKRTRPPAASRRARLESKRKRGALKRERRPPTEE